MGTIVKLPSGAQIEIRGMKGKEGKFLSDKEAIKSGTFLDKVLSACTLSVVSAYPYPDEFSKRFDWSKALLGDRFFTLLQIRVLSMGSAFTFKMQCSSGECRKRYSKDIDLLKDLPVKVLSDEDAQVFATGNTFTCTDGNGKGIAYRLPTGKDEQVAARMGDSADGAFMTALTQRIVTIDGEDVPRKYLEECEYGQLWDLLKTFDKHNCGVETEIEVECPHCGNLEDVSIPFGRGFLAPSK